MATLKTSEDASRSAMRPDPVRNIYERALNHHRAGRLNEAIKDYTAVVRLDIPPTLAADLYNNLGVALRAQGRAEAAVACYRRAIARRPSAAGIYTNLGHALQDLKAFPRAVEAHRRALKYAPTSPLALFNTGLALRDVGQTSAALEHFNRALKQDPAYALAQMEHARTLLCMGHWLDGFKALDIRFSLPGRDPRRQAIPTWTGESLQGKTILINFEGGESTVILFARFSSALKQRGARVIVECPLHMTPLLNALPDIDATISPGAPVADVDVQSPLLSLAVHLGLQVDNLPTETVYLPALKLKGPALDIPAQTHLAVGLAWSGGWSGRPANGPARMGDIKLQDLDALFCLPDIQLVSLERGQGARDIVRLGLHPLIIPAGSSFMDIADLAVIINQLDLVICVDSVATHVAGAMGKPVWLLAAPDTDWCWLLNRDDSPWYSSMQIFRKGPDQSWADLADTVRQSLVNILKGAA